jgi:PPK2 family polyphosphate:nucleotide phosphotransferase
MLEGKFENQGGEIVKRYRVQPGSSVNLKKWDPADKSAFKGNKAHGEAKVAQLTARLEPLQEMLYAEHKHKVLIVLQGMDTAGKDGVIRKVFEGIDPQGVQVANFKLPTPVELDHDYLWRAHQRVPANGEITIFNRSYYEDVLAVRVHDLVPPKVWQRRYAQINEFESMLVEEGLTVLKFFLHIDRAEQKKRLQARLDEPHKRWKFNEGDLKERDLWADYTKAYEAVLSKTSTAGAPWYIVPANSKWYRDFVIAMVLVETLRGLKMRYPVAAAGLADVVIH